MFGRQHAPRTTTTYRAANRAEETRRHDAALARQRAEQDAERYRDTASLWWGR
ncbi:hypothetical protein GCM10025864_05930 [Luteimicrobium album]|uniref:Integrase n=1 Tax=Luteimicrobium album TaxID=1054550 RepID=A0ABQ6HZ99_9MICO|nr:hypothetical protein [Luteimicrobium album]GMA22834.1 hypothetical protein GCM10025864_05930 [Luteimicrobium album]